MIYVIATFLGPQTARSRKSTIIIIIITCIAVAYVGHGQTSESYCSKQCKHGKEKKVPCQRQLTT